MSDREALRKKLQEKIRAKRDDSSSKGPQLAQRLKDDPKGAMLQMGIDDVDILKNARSIVNNPRQFLADSLTEGKKKNKRNKKKAEKDHIKEESDDEEEAPPPFKAT